MLTSRTTLIVVEDIIPRWLIRVPGFRRFWVSLKTRPVKNWILQQIVKLSAPAVVDEEVLLYADSDVFFIDSFDAYSFDRDGKVPLFLETGQRGLIPRNNEWQTLCSRLLGIEPEREYDTNYIGPMIWWRRQNALAALKRMEDVQGKPWQEVVAPLSEFSEYVLYGLYSHKILGDKSGHWHTPTIHCLNHFETHYLDRLALESFARNKKPEHYTAMVNAKSGTSLDDIRDIFSLRAGTTGSGSAQP
jgi:hypothetical protein